MNFLKFIFILIKNQLNLIADTATAIVAVKWVYDNVKFLINDSLTRYKFLFVFGFFIFILLFIRYLKNLYRKIRFQLELATINHASKLDEDKKFFEYEAIIPETKLIKSIYENVEKVVKKWSDDIYHYNSMISFHNFSHKNQLKFGYNISFYSPLKKIRISIPVTDFEISEDKIFDIATFSEEESDKHNQPFYTNPYWREALLFAIKTSERIILGQYFFIKIENMGNDINIYVSNSKVAVSKSKAFWLRDKKLFDGTNSYGEKPIQVYGEEPK